MRTAGPDKSFIDYTILKFGVRVRPGSCRTIVLAEAGWEEYGAEIPLPVPSPEIDPSGSDSWGDLLSNVVEYEKLAGVYDGEDGRQLREVLAGTIDFETALRRSLKQPAQPGAP